MRSITPRRSAGESIRLRVQAVLAVGLAAAVATAACSQPAGTLPAAADTLKTAEIKSIEYAGTGRWFQFGQAPNAAQPWPQFDVTSYTATINYETPAAHVQMTRKQTVDPARVRPTPAEQRPDQYLSGTTAWNMAAPAGSAPGTAPAPQAQPAAVEERTMEIWSTPHGFLKAAQANNATSQAVDGGSDVSFTAGKNKYVGRINAQNQVERVQTWIDNPVLGDTLVETTFSEYRDFGGTMFPGKIVRTQGGHPILDLTVSSVTANPAVDIPVPETVSAAAAPPVVATAEKLADGVYYIKGGTHHSVAIDQADHVVVVEGPQSEARSLAVIAKVKETIPNKPLRYLINTHVHFDHSSGLRTWVDEGATIVTHQLNRPYYEQAWAAPRTINPDRLAQSKKSAMFETVSDKHVLTDGKRTIEIHEIAGSGHNDGFLMVYLPREKILIEGDAYTPAAVGAPPPAVNPFAVNLHENVQRLKLDVRQIAALHGPRIATMADLRGAIGVGGNASN
jgi:glyoxylase-like metal-dependent hydrolase (beta-lactamase superfamily II)